MHLACVGETVNSSALAYNNKEEGDLLLGKEDGKIKKRSRQRNCISLASVVCQAPEWGLGEGEGRKLGT